MLIVFGLLCVCIIDRVDTLVICEFQFPQSAVSLLMLVCLGLTLCDAVPAVRKLFASRSQILLCCDCITVCLQATNSSTCTLSQQRCFYILTKVHCTGFIAVFGSVLL